MLLKALSGLAKLGFSALTGGATTVGMYAAGSLINHLSDKFSHKKVVDFNSAEYRNLQNQYVNRNQSELQASNPLLQSGGAFSRAAFDATSSLYMQAQQLNAPYDMGLGMTSMLNKFANLNLTKTMGNISSNMQEISSAFTPQQAYKNNLNRMVDTGMYTSPFVNPMTPQPLK